MQLLFLGDYLPRKPVNWAPERPQSTVANLECAIAHDATDGAKAYPIVLPPSTIEIVAQSGFAALSLANNHVYDAGAGAFRDMVGALKRVCSTQFYGIKELPYATLHHEGMHCAVIGCLERCRARGPEIYPEEEVTRLVQEIRSRFDRIIVTPHWGKEGEYTPYPSPRQRALARQWIEAGVDAILGHHSHVIQGRECIQDRPVYYSLGNFLFDHEEGSRYKLTRLGMAVEWTVAEQPESDGWQHRFFLQQTDQLQWVPSDIETVVESYFTAISADLEDRVRPWNRWRWAQAVGPVYLAKSRRSWQQRLASRPLASLPIWLLWNLLPSTWLMRWGCWFRDRGVAERTRSVLETCLDPQQYEAAATIKL